MRMTLADVEAYQVYRDTDGEHLWRDGSGYSYCRRKHGDIHTLHPVKLDRIAITGPCLGHVRDEPWRKADAEQPGSLADAHNRIDALQARLDALEQRPSVPVEPTPPPAKPTQPPDVAVYELKYLDGRVRRYEYPSYGVNFNRPLDGACETRTVLDAFDRLGWDELRRWNLSPGYEWSMDKFKWTLWRHTSDKWKKGTEIYADSEKELLTAARAIARKEGWR